MITTTKSLVLAGVFGVAVTTGLAAMVTDQSQNAARKGDLLVAPAERGGSEALVLNTEGNMSIVIRPDRY